MFSNPIDMCVRPDAQVSTFRTLEKQGVQTVPHLPRYRMPGATIPAISEPDMAAYCRECMHVVGVGEAVDAHAAHLHRVIECSPAETKQQLASMHETVKTTTPRLHKVEQALQAVNQRIDVVRDNGEATVADIQQLFNKLRKVATSL
jgi:hypothetical protein